MNSKINTVCVVSFQVLPYKDCKCFSIPSNQVRPLIAAQPKACQVESPHAMFLRQVVDTASISCKHNIVDLLPHIAVIRSTIIVKFSKTMKLSSYK